MTTERNTDATNAEIRVLDDAELDMVNGGWLKEAIDAVIDFVDAVHFEIMFLSILIGPEEQ